MRLLAAALVLCVTGYALPGLTLNAQAAEIGSVLHFAEHGIKAYVEGWLYAGAGKGEQVKDENGNMTRQSIAPGCSMPTSPITRCRPPPAEPLLR